MLFYLCSDPFHPIRTHPLMQSPRMGMALMHAAHKQIFIHSLKVHVPRGSMHDGHRGWIQSQAHNLRGES